MKRKTAKQATDIHQGWPQQDYHIQTTNWPSGGLGTTLYYIEQNTY